MYISNTFCFFSVRQDLEEDGYYGEEGGEDEYEDGEPYAKAANMELSLGTLQLQGGDLRARPMQYTYTAVQIYSQIGYRKRLLNSVCLILWHIDHS